MKSADTRERTCWRLAGVSVVVFMGNACATSGGTPEATASMDPFVGQWAYMQSCGWQHSAELVIQPGSGVLEGSWADGTRVRGDSGQLRGTPRDGKLMLRLCRDADGEGRDICPNFGSEASYLVRKHRQLVWYRANGAEGFREYLTLNRIHAGDKVPVDDDCPGEGSPSRTPGVWR